MAGREGTQDAPEALMPSVVRRAVHSAGFQASNASSRLESASPDEKGARRTPVRADKAAGQNVIRASAVCGSALH
jgi:hypothetical protein